MYVYFTIFLRRKIRYLQKICISSVPFSRRNFHGHTALNSKTHLNKVKDDRANSGGKVSCANPASDSVI